jgi:hypothetical protein
LNKKKFESCRTKLNLKKLEEVVQFEIQT